MPPLKLTDRSIAALRAPHPSGKQTFYWDTAQTGLAVLVSGKSDVKSFMAKGPLDGKNVVKALGKVGVVTLAEARQAAREVLRDLGAGVDPRKKKLSSVTLGDALASYIAAHDLAPRTKDSYAGVTRYFPDWTNLPLKDLTREAVEARHRAIAEEVERRHAEMAGQHAKIHLRRAEKVARQWPEAAEQHRAKAEAAKERKAHSGKATANGAMRILRALYNFAADRTPDLPPNPVRLKRQWHRVNPRERVVSADDMAKFYEAVLKLESPIGRDYLLLVMFTGLRRREATALRWSEVDLKARTITIPAARNKSGRKFDLPLSDFVHNALVARRAVGKTEYIFPADSKSGHIESPRYHLDQVAAACGVRVSVHDLRRTFITVAESCDISPIALKALVNHGLGNDVTSGYIQMNVERLREPAQRVTNKIKELCGVTEVTDDRVRRLRQI